MPDAGRVAFRRRQPGDPVFTRTPKDDADGGATAGRRIRCPQCGWQPSRSSRWSCAPVGPPENYPAGCGTIWNTFDTGGRCPGCDHTWEWTSCLSCLGWSRHLEWYEDEDDGD